ncbi:unnamed protein product [Discula destructiva]
MVDSKTAWLLANTTCHIILLLLKCAALIGVLYFAIFTATFIAPFFANLHNDTCAYEAKIVIICCFVVLTLLALLTGEQMLRLLLSIYPAGGRNCYHRYFPGQQPPWMRVAHIATVVLLLGAIFFGTLYPLLKALAWRVVLADGDRLDLEEAATTLAGFMGFTLGVGMLSVLRVAWDLVVKVVEALRQSLDARRKKGSEGRHAIPLEGIEVRPSFRMQRMAGM